jgi:D-3-phosphoglycerate dehydrogenase / 2-oxoglutarate reductase
MGDALGMQVVYWSRSSTNHRFVHRDLDELMKESDFVFPTLAKNTETIQMLNREKIGMMKQGAHIVSVTGDELFDFEYGLERVKEGSISGIALESEGKSIENFDGNVLVTPPIAWYTNEAVAEDMRIWVESICSCANGSPINLVN